MYSSMSMNLQYCISTNYDKIQHRILKGGTDLSLNLEDIKNAFQTCEFPFYKDIKIAGDEAECTLYSIKADYHAKITLELSSFEKLVHQISIKLIKFKSHEVLENQTAIKQAEGISFKFD